LGEEDVAAMDPSVTVNDLKTRPESAAAAGSWPTFAPFAKANRTQG